MDLLKTPFKNNNITLMSRNYNGSYWPPITVSIPFGLLRSTKLSVSACVFGDGEVCVEGVIVGMYTH